MDVDELVGRAHILKALKRKFLGREEPLRVCVISGMTGIGKTALARCIYHDPYVRAHFTCRAWVTVSPKGSKLDDIAWSLPGCNNDNTIKISSSPFDMQQLNKILPGNRYLVVIDNLWDLRTWQEAIKSAPDDTKGSRIIVTTQNGVLARDVRLSNGYKEVGELCLIELMALSLIQVLNYSSIDMGIKTCKVHVIYRGFCIKEARDEGFFHVIKKLEHANASFLQGTVSQPRLCFHNNIVLGFKQARAALESVSSACFLLCYGPRHQYPVLNGTPLPFKLLKVLDAPAVRFYEFPDQVLSLVRLRYLAITYDGEIPSCISGLCDLQVLIVHRHQIVRSSFAVATSYLPMEIWTLRKLRHLHCMGWDLPDPSTTCFLLKNLLTLSGVSSRSCTHGVLARMPKLEKVGVQVVPAHDAVETFAFFSNFSHQYFKFESFKCIVVGPDLGTSFVSLVTPSFPFHIRKITLSGCRFPWDYIKVIAELINLRVLKLRQYAFQGPECLMSDVNFFRLRFLLMEDLDVENFIAGTCSFLKLRSIRIRHCYKLKSFDLGQIIPDDIEVDDCGVVIEEWTRGFKKQHLAHVRIRSSRNNGGSKNKS
ncbi:Disease resistance protein RPP13 [Striga hermonthica]|uniref:Disease resistance protein RPP13 n=1 Tax=Striga hermonthica TaxID=68872 RepID=A0A9N7N491_STRHE|nr:Disease resistance protein RPP13 [Striga hermonthica]